MRMQSRPPGTIRILAALFLLQAALAVLQVIIGLAHGRLQFAFGLVGFWVAPGLRRGDERWRRGAIALSVLELLVTGASVAVLLNGGGGTINVLGIPRSAAPHWLFLLIGILGGLVAAWQVWALTDPATRRWFGSGAGAARQTSEFTA